MKTIIASRTYCATYELEVPDDMTVDEIEKMVIAEDEKQKCGDWMIDIETLAEFEEE